jgi:hypothetical protein
MNYFQNLNSALHQLTEMGAGTLLARDRDDGSKEYLLFPTETKAWDCYNGQTTLKIHSVNFSCLHNACSKFFMDYESPRASYTQKNESEKHRLRLRKFIRTVDTMLSEVKVTRCVEWVLENRSRFEPESGLYKTSFHVYSSLTFPNNYEILPSFVRAAAEKSGLDISFIDFGVYQSRSLLSVIGSCSKRHVNLAQASEEDFYLSLTASMGELPDITSEHMESLDLEWKPRMYDETPPVDTLARVDQIHLKDQMIQALADHGETINRLVKARGNDVYYGESSTEVRHCLTFPGNTHHSNRCLVWLHEGAIFYRCMDPDHVDQVMCLGKFQA